MNNKKYLLILGVISTAYIPTAKADLVQCLACSAGTYGKNGECIKCSAGTYSSAGASSCTTCEAGYYCTNGKRTACSAGTYSSAGASSCTTCEAGHYCIDGKKYACADGQYQNSTGKYYCKICPGTPINNISVSLTYQYASKYGAIYNYKTINKSQNLTEGTNYFSSFTGWETDDKKICNTCKIDYSTATSIYWGKINGKTINSDCSQYIDVTCDKSTGNSLKATVRCNGNDIIIYSK